MNGCVSIRKDIEKMGRRNSSRYEKFNHFKDEGEYDGKERTD
jgi:hypothetical protein